VPRLRPCHDGGESEVLRGHDRLVVRAQTDQRRAARAIEQDPQGPLGVSAEHVQVDDHQAGLQGFHRGIERHDVVHHGHHLELRVQEPFEGARQDMFPGSDDAGRDHGVDKIGRHAGRRYR